jgi:hypothetical protein
MLLLNLDLIFSNEKINDFMVFDYNFTEHDNVDFFVNFLKSLSTRFDKIPQRYLVNEVDHHDIELP